MDLKNNQITMKELSRNKAAFELIKKRFPRVISEKLIEAAGSLTLAQVLELAGVYVPPAVLNETVRDLKRL
ncbi:hypothetical protein SDC9_48275 [bioreactor metagenome]|uniref:Uncharacterized protein n=1 Tax=bioreactor metagenome TaxID=1076179 RepID=A0A644WDY3_9ZZZZ